jgi:hypothetical protein
MAFIKFGSEFLSFATSDDLVNLDRRLFEQNEGLDDNYIQDSLIRSTARILELLRATDWWRSYFIARNTGPNAVQLNTVADIPPLRPERILARQPDFTDLCCYYALYNYILPYIADFSNEDSAERRKMGYYQQKYDLLFGELITAGDWYDFDDSETVDSADKQPGVWNLRRVR